MSRDLTPSAQAAVESPNTSPLYLVQLSFATTTLRYSSFGTLTWRGLTWLGRNLTVSGLGSDGAPSVEVFDADATLRTLILSDGIADRPVDIWSADQRALGAGDPVLLFSGVGGALRWAGGRVSLSTARANARSSLCPRTRMTPETGYNFLAPAGYEFRWGDRIVRLD